MNRRRGFTLVELLIATTMMAFLAGAAFAALSAGTGAAGKAKRHGALLAHGQAALHAMTADIRAAVEHGDDRLVSLDTEYEGRAADTIDFVAAVRAKLGRDEPGTTGRCEVGYYIENDPDTEIRWLLRREDGTVDDDVLEGGAVALAGPYVAALDLAFYDGQYWQSGWDDTERFPKAVDIQIVVVDEYGIENPLVLRTTVPILAQ